MESIKLTFESKTNVDEVHIRITEAKMLKGVGHDRNYT